MVKRLLLYGLICSATVHAQEHLYDYTLFTNSRIGGNYFYSKTSFQSPSFIKNENQRLPVSTTVYHTPGTALQLEYVNGLKGNWMTTIFRGSLRSQDHFKPAQYLSFSIYVSSQTNLKGLPACQLMLRDSSLSNKFKLVINKIGGWETIYIPVSFLRELILQTLMMLSVLFFRKIMMMEISTPFMWTI